MDDEEPDTLEENAPELLNHIAGVLAELRKIASEAKLEEVVASLDAAIGEVVSMSILREVEEGAPDV